MLPTLILNSSIYSRTVQGALVPTRTRAASVQTQKSGYAVPDASKGSGCPLDAAGGVWRPPTPGECSVYIHIHTQC